MLKRIFTFVFSSIVFSSTAHSGMIEVAQWVPWSFVQEQVHKEAIDLSSFQTNASYKWDEFEPQASAASLILKGSFQNLAFDEKGLSAESQFLDSSLVLDGVNLDQVIVKDFGGNQISIQIKASCSTLKLSIPRITTKFSFLYTHESAFWKPSLASLKMAMPEGWMLEPFTCNGIGGLTEEISQSIKTALNQPEIIEAVILPKLKAKLESYWTLKWTEIVASMRGSLYVTSMDMPSSDGFFIRAELPIKASKTINLTSLSFVPSMNKPQLIIGQQGFEALMEDKLLEMAPQKFDMRKIKGFAKLLKSNFLKFFVWPDLKRFNAETPFYLSLNKEQSKLRLTRSSKGEWNSSMNANGVLEVDMKNSLIDYLTWGMSVQTPMKLTIKDSQLLINSGIAKLNIAWNFGAIYELIFSPKKQISTKLLGSAISQSFSNQNVKAELPYLKLREKRWLLQNWQDHDEFITMDWNEEIL